VQSWRRETLSLARAREFLPRVAFGKEFKGQRWGADKSVWIARRLAHFGRQLFAERPLCATSGHPITVHSAKARNMACVAVNCLGRYRLANAFVENRSLTRKK
jgi:hypothetical protein